MNEIIFKVLDISTIFAAKFEVNEASLNSIIKESIS